MSNKKHLLHVEIKLKNVGNVLFNAEKAEIRARQVFPLPDSVEKAVNENLDPVQKGNTEIEWDMLQMRKKKWKKGEFEIKPGENDSIHAEFFIEPHIEIIQFYFYLANYRKLKKGIGWTITQFYHLKRGKHEQKS